MPPSLVACYRTSTTQPLFLGTDGKNQTAVQSLVALGALNFQPTPGPQPPPARPPPLIRRGPSGALLHPSPGHSMSRGSASEEVEPPCPPCLHDG